MAFDITKFFKDDNYISPGSIGGKIKKFRELRGLTQKQLGIMCGFSPSSADVRIAQYEKNKKVPREKILKDLCEALQIDECALFDVDLLTQYQMYHVLFDIEDFHGLHPVKKADGYYLKFNGHNILNNFIETNSYDEFLAEWYEIYQKYLPTTEDTAEEKSQKLAEYTLWRSEYPNNVAKENSNRIRAIAKMNTLQSQIDQLHAEVEGENELKKLDEVMAEPLKEAYAKYIPITKESEFILLIQKMYEANIPIVQQLPSVRANTDHEHIHIISIKTENLIDNTTNQEYFAEFVFQIEAMQKAGLDITRRITSKNKELYVTYEIPSSQVNYIHNLNASWEDMELLKENRKWGSVERLKEVENRLLDRITGDNDVTFSSH